MDSQDKSDRSVSAHVLENTKNHGLLLAFGLDKRPGIEIVLAALDRLEYDIVCSLDSER
jgi:hypothetical protein